MSILFHSALLLQAVVLSVLFVCVFVVVRPQYLKYALFFFACSFPLYGSHSYQLHNIVFELFVTTFALVCLLSANRTVRVSPVANGLAWLVGCYVLLAFLSLLLAPLSSVVSTLVLWGWHDFFSYVLQAPPESPFYSLAAVNRLTLYVLFAVLLSSLPDRKQLYRYLFSGLVCGAVLAAIVGLLNYYHLLPLDWFRETVSSGRRLQSFFGNPGWFAEFLSISIPFILVGFLAPGAGTIGRLLLFAFLVVCEMAILLTASRTGWLVYPLVLVSCWLFFYLSRKIAAGMLSWKDVGRVAVKVVLSVPLTIAISYFLVTGILHLKGGGTGSMIRQRFVKIADPAARKKIWQESLAIGLEAPGFGMGYERYKYHVTALATVKDSLYEKSRQIKRIDYDTPHNLYIQLFISNGVVGLLLWSIIIFYVVVLLFYDLKSNKRYFNIAVFLSLVAFHQYGLAQSMQYIGVIWFIAFLDIGYAMTLNQSVLPGTVRMVVSGAIGLFIFLVCIAGIVYGRNFGSRLLAAKYGMRVYAADQDILRYQGFYPREEWKGKGVFHWTGPRARLALSGSGVVRLQFFCSTPDLYNNPVVLDVFSSGRPLDRVTFWSNRMLTRTYYIPPSGSGQAGRLDLRVSRTWNPRQEGVSPDTRNLGIAVREPEYLGKTLKSDLGLYRWQMSSGNNLKMESGSLFRYRWSHWQAVLDLKKEKRNPETLLLKSALPWIGRRPLEVRFLQENVVLDTVKLPNDKWTKIPLPKGLDYDSPLTILVDRTWNPMRQGYGDDPRDLGVAVHVVQK